MLTLQDITYIHPNKDLLFTDLDFIVNNHQKIALVGNNGTGKSTLLKILAGELQPSGGLVKADPKPYYVPQLFGQFNDHSVAEALRIDVKLNALREILEGRVTEENMELLNDDWTIEERCHEALAHWGLADFDLTQKMELLSGGQKTKVFLAGIDIHQPETVLLDEPSNHLDISGRKLLYDYITRTSNSLVIVSHDRTLLNLLNTVCELSKRGITTYGGNYDFYAEQKMIESDALNQDVKSKEKALRKAKETAKESIERQQKLDARGKKKQEKAGVPTIMMNTLRNSAENSTSKMKGIHAEKVGNISQELSQLRKELPGIDKMKMDFDNSTLHTGKTLINARGINFGYDDELLWKLPLTFQVTSGERLVIKGANGSGKTTLVRMMLGDLHATSGTLDRATVKTIYIDQDYSIINNALSVYEQAQQFNSGALQEHDIKIRLNRFLFTREYWDKPCRALSGGEKMRLMLCSLTISNRAPDIMILDEPTNNLDIQNIEILTNAINEYKGTLLIISHDEYFLKEVNVERAIELS
ncbi:ABC-F family ATP-binding cassette domain-containing protein [Mucilaginibacter sp. HC2]|uniref:ABC-F family ATP-binding cassette domain-containing protein n=1 Tax=Mucilaginibacter inviolabilis TaxID=2714892 RepID=UPI00140E4149|nr:ABC-F family ATP-binding cassette domain-containing protein [Mucilaginibacter inviolabilis]NHA07182.1 ABC-F family ATP-binding cassette domain-containing protein [Mucilaginibacter inviolabilis]